MKNTLLKILGIILFTQIFYSCSINNKNASESNSKNIAMDSMLYFGQTPPANTPVLFAPDIISKPNRYEFGCTLSEDGKEFYFGVDIKGQMEIDHTSLENGKWIPPENLFPNDSSSNNESV